MSEAFNGGLCESAEKREANIMHADNYMRERACCLDKRYLSSQLDTAVDRSLSSAERSL